MLAGGALRTESSGLEAVGPVAAFRQGQTWMQEGGFRPLWKGRGPRVRMMSWQEMARVGDVGALGA